MNLTNQQKIEAIQERMEVMYDNKTYHYNDIAYLLQRLERYETALKHVRDYERLEENWEVAKVIDEALKEE